eukprot:4350160-Amphidinium_carterae.1
MTCRLGLLVPLVLAGIVELIVFCLALLRTPTDLINSILDYVLGPGTNARVYIEVSNPSVSPPRPVFKASQSPKSNQEMRNVGILNKISISEIQ